MLWLTTVNCEHMLRTSGASDPIACLRVPTRFALLLAAMAAVGAAALKALPRGVARQVYQALVLHTLQTTARRRHGSMASRVVSGTACCRPAAPTLPSSATLIRTVI